MHRQGLAAVLTLSLSMIALAVPTFAFESKKKELKAAEEALPAKYRQWLNDVHFLISEDERIAFLELQHDYQRDAFIERFWRTRDPFPGSTRNEFRDQWMSRLEFARSEFGDLTEDRARYLLTNGPPTQRIDFRCTTVTWPIEVWFYKGSERVRDEFFLLFVRRFGTSRYTLWRPADGIDELAENRVDTSNLFRQIFNCKDGDVVSRVIRFLLRSNGMDFELLIARIDRPAEDPSDEWLTAFSAYSTDVEPGAESLPAELELSFPERHQNRTVVQASLLVPRDAAEVSPLNAGSFNFFVTGEVLREGQLFDNFRYKFDIPPDGVAEDTIPLLFQRPLRPGSYRLIVKLEDLNSKRVFRQECDLEVPRLEAPPVVHDPETARILEAAEAAITSDRPTLKIVEPHAEMLTGMVRFETLTTGETIDEVRFTLNGDTVLRKQRPPYSIELDLGAVPRLHELRVTAVDAGGKVIASDEITINPGKHRFELRLTEPRQGKRYVGQVEAVAQVTTPEQKVTERVEFYLNETLLATVYQPPYRQRLSLPDGGIAYVEAVAYLSDGNSTRDGVFVNGPDFVEEVDIEYVELFATVLDKQGRPVQDLSRGELEILEDGEGQEIRRFEKVDNLPIHAQVMIDVSASMEDNLDQTQRAALRFFQEAITPKDRASLITFNDHPYLAVEFTNEHEALAGGLAGLRAERGTALYDSLVFGLYYLAGIKGQRTILLLSDGKDESSRFTFENTLEYARRAGVSIYAIGLNITGKNSSQARSKLTRFADETGGRAFFIKSVGELDEVYQTIQLELRSRYLITYQSTNSSPDESFRTIDLTVRRNGVQAKTMRGYYP